VFLGKPIVEGRSVQAGAEVTPLAAGFFLNHSEPFASKPGGFIACVETRLQQESLAKLRGVKGKQFRRRGGHILSRRFGR
jgi:hypothetical protein